jgi:hypothetical protein
VPATSAGIGRAPYEASVSLRVCSCGSAPKVLGVGRDLDRVIRVADGYWTVYLTFFGDQLVWLEWIVTDVRDGRIMWRNGRRITEETTDGRQVSKRGRSAADRLRDP